MKVYISSLVSFVKHIAEKAGGYLKDLFIRRWRYFLIGIFTGLIFVAFFLGYWFGLNLGFELIGANLQHFNYNVEESPGNSMNSSSPSSPSFQENIVVEGDLEISEGIGAGDSIYENDDDRAGDPHQIIMEMIDSGFAEALIMPVHGDIMSPYGWVKDNTSSIWVYSPSISFNTSGGEGVRASMSGVIFSLERKVHGYIVEILHPLGINTRYKYITNMNVDEGDKIEQGQIIGYVPASGVDRSLEFSVYEGGSYVDPERYLYE